MVSQIRPTQTQMQLLLHETSHHVPPGDKLTEAGAKYYCIRYVGRQVWNAVGGIVRFWCAWWKDEREGRVGRIAGLCRAEGKTWVRGVCCDGAWWGW